MDDFGDELIKVFGFDPRAEPSLPTVIPAPARAPAPKEKRREAEAFVHVTDRELLAGLRVLDSAQELAVWLYILRERRWRQRKGQTEAFPLTNVALRAWAGIGQMTKSRTLRKLSAAGLIRIERGGRQSPRVTVC